MHQISETTSIDNTVTVLNEIDNYKNISRIIDNFTDYKSFDITKKRICNIIDSINPIGTELLLNIIFEKFKYNEWQIKLGAIDILNYCSFKNPQMISYYIPEIIENLINLTSEVKKEIKVAVKSCFEQVAKTIDNVDIIHLIPIVISAYLNPKNDTQNALDKLVSTPFVNDIDLQTLGFLTPLLIKSMRTRKMVYQRRAAVVIETLCKLIKSPIYAKIFYPRLAPELERGKEEIAEIEIRKVCDNALKTLTNIYNLGLNKEKEQFTYEECQIIFNEFLKSKTQYFNTEIDSELIKIILNYSCQLCYILCKNELLEDSYWKLSINEYFNYILLHTDFESICSELKNEITKNVIIDQYNPEDDEENLCDCMFSLAYGTRVLLHQTPFKVKIGRKYGLVGPNGAGKSTLMKAIANKNLQEFPEDLNCIYVEHDIQGNKSDLTVLNYVLSDEKVISKNLSTSEVNNSLIEIGFDENMINGPVTALSGGWRMKLSLCRAMMLNPDMLLLDEPTNHLDEFAVKWLVNYVNNLSKTTCLIVSHDTKFLDNVCTNIIHYENLKLKLYRGNLAEFVKQKPEAKQYYSLVSDILSFNFPEPGPLEGVKSLSKAVVKMKNCYFQYPKAPKPQLIDVSIQISLASRVAVVGVNGAGKSTLIKLLVGELEADQGIIERHPNVRVAYVAQHAFHHIEDHLEKTPIEYVMWRYRGGYDKEALGNESLTMTEEELEAIKKRAKENKEMFITELIGRRTGKREHEYEAKNDSLDITQWFGKSELIQMGYEKLVKEKDQQIAMESLLGQRKLTTNEIQKHFDNFGLEPNFAQHSKIGMLSGGQRMRCTLAGCTWGLPHIIILDEPTNFLDRDSQAALSGAIKTFKGGILVISHNSEFYESICSEKPEKWLLEGGKLSVMGGEWIEEVEKARKKAEKENAKKLNFDQDEDKFDSLGNKIEAVKEKKELNRADRKKLMKQKAQMEKDGLDTYEIDKLLGLDE
uniref:ABC transporter domain-containing protein n=1 Tax=viral metagenome TaxID=1070528 RepID=A0A6C0ICZ1_9ZZZZ